ncbi:MAG: hypothetical protein JWN70_4825 [Planctomycetaceae bacterium]|nr:hypothetical protein [Planctomycetaceae bacterium]
MCVTRVIDSLAIPTNSWIIALLRMVRIISTILAVVLQMLTHQSDGPASVVVANWGRWQTCDDLLYHHCVEGASTNVNV